MSGASLKPQESSHEFFIFYRLPKLIKAPPKITNPLSIFISACLCLKQGERELERHLEALSASPIAELIDLATFLYWTNIQPLAEGLISIDQLRNELTDLLNRYMLSTQLSTIKPPEIEACLFRAYDSFCESTPDMTSKSLKQWLQAHNQYVTDNMLHDLPNQIIEICKPLIERSAVPISMPRSSSGGSSSSATAGSASPVQKNILNEINHLIKQYQTAVLSKYFKQHGVVDKDSTMPEQPHYPSMLSQYGPCLVQGRFMPRLFTTEICQTHQGHNIRRICSISAPTENVPISPAVIFGAIENENFQEAFLFLPFLSSDNIYRVSLKLLEQMTRPFELEYPQAAITHQNRPTIASVVTTAALDKKLVYQAKGSPHPSPTPIRRVSSATQTRHLAKSPSPTSFQQTRPRVTTPILTVTTASGTQQEEETQDTDKKGKNFGRCSPA